MGLLSFVAQEMIGGEELYKLQIKHGLPKVLQKHIDWSRYTTAMRAWIKTFDPITVYTILGTAHRPLILHKGMWLDIVTGTQFYTSGVCKDSLQMALHPIRYSPKTAKNRRKNVF